MKDYITVSQAAKKLNISVETVYNMLRDGRLGGRYSRGNGRKKGSWLVSYESINLFEKNTVLKSIYEVRKNSQGTLF